MNATVLSGLVAATTLFWCVGLYNRLMRMRASGLDALGALEKQLHGYASLINVQFPNEEGCYIPLEWARLVSHVKRLEPLCQAARLAPLQPPPLRTLALAVDAIDAEWQLLRSQPADLAGPSMPEAMHKLWDEVTHKVATARGSLNQIITRYNEALHQFPASLVAGLMGFQEAATL